MTETKTPEPSPIETPSGPGTGRDAPETPPRRTGTPQPQGEPPPPEGAPPGSPGDDDDADASR